MVLTRAEKDRKNALARARRHALKGGFSSGAGIVGGGIVGGVHHRHHHAHPMGNLIKRHSMLRKLNGILSAGIMSHRRGPRRRLI